MFSFENIRYIYNKLEDGISKNIFQKRLMYSISEDKKYINEMVSDEMRRYGNSDIVMSLIQWLQCRTGSVIVFGAGFAGQQIINMLVCNGIHVKYIVDNNPDLWGMQRFGAAVENPEKMKEEIDGYSVVIGTNKCIHEIKNQLLQMNVPEKNIFVPLKQWWIGTEKQYFDTGIMKPDKNESFIDGGALDGGDSLNFIQWCKDKYDHIYLFEPDPANYKNINALKEKNNRWCIYKEGLWSTASTLRFSAGNAENSCISDVGNAKINVVSIDEKLGGRPVTFIKMDIEGSELEALNGAEQTIKIYKPRLAICVYHKPEDIIEIPLRILQLNSEYKLYLRHYSYLETETVVYAV